MQIQILFGFVYIYWITNPISFLDAWTAEHTCWIHKHLRRILLCGCKFPKVRQHYVYASNPYSYLKITPIDFRCEGRNLWTVKGSCSRRSDVKYLKGRSLKNFVKGILNSNCIFFRLILTPWIYLDGERINIPVWETEVDTRIMGHFNHPDSDCNSNCWTHRWSSDIQEKQTTNKWWVQKSIEFFTFL